MELSQRRLAPGQLARYLVRFAGIRFIKLALVAQLIPQAQALLVLIAGRLPIRCLLAL